MRSESAVLGTISKETDKSKADVDYAINLSRWFLFSIGLWPLQSDAHILMKIYSAMLAVVSYSLIIFLFVPCALHTIFMEKNTTKQMKMIGPLSFCLMGITKYSILLSKGRKIQLCIGHIDNDWRRVKCKSDHNIMLDNAKFGRFIATICASFTYSGAFFYRTILPLSIGSIVTPDNRTIRPLAYPVYEPWFTAQTSPIYEIVFGFQWIGGFIIYTIAISTCNLAAVFALHACGQLNIVMSRLETCTEGRQYISKILEDRIAEIIELHLRSLKFIFLVEDILSAVCFFEVIGCTWILCFVLYYIITEVAQYTTTIVPLLTYYLLLTSFTFDIFIYCYIGEKLNQEGKKVGSTAYLIDWYTLPAKVSRSLILVLAMSNYPANLTAGKMLNLSYDSFKNIVKSAVAYLNILRTLVA